MAKDFWDYSENESRRENNYVDISENAVVGAGVRPFMAKVFGWMFLGLIVTAGAAFAFLVGLSISPTVQRLASSSAFLFSLLIAEMVAVFSISLGIRKISAGTAKLLFVLYAALNGVTLSFLCLVYAGTTITLALVMTSVFFGIMAIYGYTTKADLTKFGPILFAALITLLVMTIVNMFMGSSMLEYIICLAGLGIFAGLTAYDVKKIKSVYYEMANTEGGEMAAKLSIIGALALYLDFINMFMYLLRLLGRRK